MRYFGTLLPNTADTYRESVPARTHGVTGLRVGGRFRP